MCVRVSVCVVGEVVHFLGIMKTIALNKEKKSLPLRHTLTD